MGPKSNKYPYERHTEERPREDGHVTTEAETGGTHGRKPRTPGTPEAGRGGRGTLPGPLRGQHGSGTH